MAVFFFVSPVRRVLVLSWFLCAAGALCFLPRHVAAAGVGSYVTVSTASFAASGTTCDDAGPVIAPRQRNGTSAVLRLAHRHGPCAPSRSSVQAGPSFAEVLRADQLRAEYIQRRVSGAGARGRGQQLVVGSSKSATVPATMGYSIGTLQYVVTLSLGTPGVQQTLELDTGSDVSWVQCKPCSPPACYSQKDPLFDPAQSSTYSTVPCSADACLELGIFSDGCSGSQCLYVVSYGDGSNTTGVYSSDTLTLTPGTSSGNEVEPFLFGCGRVQTGLFIGIDGLLALGRQSMSLRSQASNAYGGVFSYCLPPKETSTGYLTLGGPSSASGFVTTGLLTAWNAPTFYVVMLTGISVGGQQVGGVPTSVFAGGTVVDTGTVITRLPPTAYTALRSAFRSAMTRYSYPSAPAMGILDTCYDFSRYDVVTLPTVALTFSGGATLALEAPGILSSGCLAFAPNGGDGDVAILGNVQQRSFAVRFDGSTVGFMPGAC
ncbi:unnamed protein product [Alopecurus aequalis]